jgi:hypothetical protein
MHRMSPLHIQLASSTLRKVIERLHYPLEVMLVCVRWYAAYPLSLRNLEEMMAERGVIVDHATVHRWALKILPCSGDGVSPTQAPGWLLLARGRDLHQGGRPVEVSATEPYFERVRAARQKAPSLLASQYNWRVSSELNSRRTFSSEKPV